MKMNESSEIAGLPTDPWRSWLASAPGRYVLDWEQGQFDQAVVDLFGNRTDVIFESVRSNLPVDAAQFRFEAGPGVRVLRAEPPGGGSPSQ